jgi:cruciform cutting endonuclease 1
MAALKAWQLRHWAFLTGAASIGTKAELQAVLTSAMAQSAAEERRNKGPNRIVSVDMGIRNLAFCALEIPDDEVRIGKGRRSLTVTTWRRKDLLDVDHQSPSQLQSSPPSPPPSGGEKASKKPSKQPKSPVLKDTFTPSSLSRTAYSLTTSLLSLHPSVLLIERQRFRSGGAAAIQEWTVRVNMLESMIWACLQTLRAERGEAREQAFPKVEAVNPARVGQFWMEGVAGVPLRPGDDSFNEDGSSSLQGLLGGASSAAAPAAKEKKAKADKKSKVAIVKKWVRGQDPDVEVKFEGQAEEIAAAFRLEGRVGAREVAGGKLDDLADCLLQGVAWARWEENRAVMGRLWEEG